jgi:PAS domain S-box-containing protein
MTRNSIQRVFETGCAERLENQGAGPNGAISWYLTTLAPLPREGKVQAIALLAADMTAHKRAEQALRESETKFRTLAESISAGAFIFLGTKMRYVNSAAERISGYARQELLAMDFWEVVHPESQALVKERGMARQRGEPVPNRYEVKLLTKQGEERWVDFTATLIEFEGKPAVLGTALDVTARKRLEEQLQQHTENLEKLVEARTAHIRELEKQRIETEKLAATGRMAARIAHEINNPLGSIQTAFRLIGRAVPAGHRHHHYVAKIDNEIERIARIVRQMLELHKPHVEAPKAFRPDVTIEEVLALLKPQFFERQIRFELDLERARKIITLPENMLRQILYNVILNAQEASPPNSVVLITAQVEEKSLEITVADRGAGIPEEIKARIFEPFFTTKSNGSSGGLGLGLSICKSLVEAMNGTITFDGNPGEGTICRIWIPLKNTDEP